MSDLAIRLRGLTKAYRLYKSSSDKALGIFNLRLGRLGAYSEHLAIDHIDLDIRRGERVGVIGRNGSGKSTLLKLISRTTAPTSGSLEVYGGIHVLMNLGTGFHPDFTGRENAYAYLAQMGITGTRADDLISELAIFAEVGQYFDQPLSTYSSGMQLRLMFAAATVISPDILLLDEVLGVGDAYFVHKSFARLRALCTREGTTLILVTHSPHMAAEICKRLVWLDAGRVMMDGEPLAVINAYEASIRDQEEQRLRRMNQDLARESHEMRERAPIVTSGDDALRQLRSMEEMAETGGAEQDAENEPRGDASDLVAGDIQPDQRPLIEISSAATGKAVEPASAAGSAFLSAEMRTVADRVPRGNLYLSHVRLLAADRVMAVLDFAMPSRTVNAQAIDDPAEGDWGAVMRLEGRRARQYQRYGSIYHKLPLVVRDPSTNGAMPELTAEVAYWTDTPEQLSFSLFHPDGISRSFGVLDLSTRGEWSVANVGLTASSAAEPDESARYGTRHIELEDFTIYGADDRETMLFEVGDPMRIHMRYRVNDPGLDERPTFMVGFHKDGLHSTHRWWTDAFRIAARHRTRGTLDVIASPLLLGPGKYTITLAAFREGHIVSPGVKKYFTLSDQLYDMHTRSRQIEVTTRDSANPLYYDFVFQHPSRWIYEGQEAISTFIGDRATPDDRIYLSVTDTVATRRHRGRPKVG